MDTDVSSFEQIIGFSFNNKHLLLQALTHRSFLNEEKNWPVGHNERLEFFGDTVIEFIVTNFLFDAFPDKQEGELTKLRAKLACTSALAQVGENIKLYDHLRISIGERKGQTQRQRTRLVTCAFEAVVGALYRDKGYAETERFLRDVLLSQLNKFCNQNIDSKSLLQEKAQVILASTPTYKTLEESGPDNDKRFVVGVYFGDRLIAKGHGPSKKYGQEKAAEAALRLRGWIQ